MQLNIRDVSRLLKVSENKVYEWITDDGLPAQRINSHYYFNKAELLEWATLHKIDMSIEIFCDDDHAGAGDGLAEALQAGGIFYNVPGDDKPAVLRSVVERMPLPDGFDSELLLDLMLARESHGTTAVGDGIAIPHPRTPIIAPLDRPTMTLCFLSHPVPFGSADNQPVHTIFALLAPHIKSHLNLLARTAFMIRQPEFRNLIIKRAQPQVIIDQVRRLDAVPA